MSQLREFRDELKTVISGVTDTQVFSSFPDKYVPPAIFVTPDSPYITAGQTFGELRANYQIWVVAKDGDNKTVIEFHERNLEAILPALDQDGWSVDQVDGPFLTTVASNQYMALIIRASAPLTFI